MFHNNGLNLEPLDHSHDTLSQELNTGPRLTLLKWSVK